MNLLPLSVWWLLLRERLQALLGFIKSLGYDSLSIERYLFVNFKSPSFFFTAVHLGFISHTSSQKVQFVNTSKMTGHHKVLTGFIDAGIGLSAFVE